MNRTRAEIEFEELIGRLTRAKRIAERHKMQVTFLACVRALRFARMEYDERPMHCQKA